MKFNY